MSAATTAPAKPAVGTTDRSRLVAWFLRILGLAASAWICFGPADGLVERLVPAQRAVFEALMRDFSVSVFQAQRSGAQLKLREESVSSHYLVVRGKAYPPGVSFEAETPARSALVYAALILGGTAMTIRGSVKAASVSYFLALLMAMAMSIFAPSLVLAGAHWGIAFEAFEDLSRPVVLVGISDFLIHGGAFALCAAAVAVAVMGCRKTD